VPDLPEAPAPAEKTLVLEMGAEVRRLAVLPDEVLAVIMPEDFSFTPDNVERLKQHWERAGMPCKIALFMHGTELAVIQAEAATT
jgi:hypothetical protein